MTEDDSSHDVAAAAEMNEKVSRSSGCCARKKPTAIRMSTRVRIPRHARARAKQIVRQSWPDTVLVFRDQHTQDVRNYAIVGQTLWNFAPGRTQKIALSDLDLPATTKANDERGLTFRVPAAGEAQ